VGTRDSALDSMAWEACAGRLRTGTSLSRSRLPGMPTARPMI
jgi:hypothetical protein